MRHDFVPWDMMLCPSELPPEEGKPLWVLVLEQLNDLFIKILLFSAAISFVSCCSVVVYYP